MLLRDKFINLKVDIQWVLFAMMMVGKSTWLMLEPLETFLGQSVKMAVQYSAQYCNPLQTTKMEWIIAWNFHHLLKWLWNHRTSNQYIVIDGKPYIILYLGAFHLGSSSWWQITCWFPIFDIPVDILPLTDTFWRWNLIFAWKDLWFIPKYYIFISTQP